MTSSPSNPHFSEADPFVLLWGSPLDFSLSPFFQEHSSILSGRRFVYRIFRGEKERFSELLHDGKCLGANITIPNKINALDLCDELTEKACEAGSVNTVFKKGTKLIGDSTDGGGLVKWLKIKGFPLERIAILGNGGSARSIAAALSAERSGITVFGRNKKGWEEKFGAFKELTEWKNDLPTISTLPFKVEGRNVITIGYNFENINIDAVMMLAFQGWLAAQRWLGETITAEKFAQIAQLHAEAMQNRQLILNLAGKK